MNRRARHHWMYGVTTVPKRRNDFLRRTLYSLERAGFDKPWLFVDGERDATSWREQFGLEVTIRWPVIGTYGNWILSLSEMLIRNPYCHYYAIFQDDLITSMNLKAYLDRCTFPEKGYWNLYTFPENEILAPRKEDGERKVGWYESNQKGKGAVALVFSRNAVVQLLKVQTMIEKVISVNRPTTNVDGAVVTAMNIVGWKEYVHFPSLVQHIGDVSSMGNMRHPKSESYRGENFDLLELLEKGESSPLISVDL